MLDDPNPRAVIGGNAPPPYDVDVLAEHQNAVQEFLLAAAVWIRLGAIETKEQSERLTDFTKGAQANRKRVDDARKAAKKPHDDAGKAIQDAYTPLITKIDKVVDQAKAMQAIWLKAELAREEARKAEAARKAREEQEAAARLAAQAEARGDISGIVDAEEQLKAANKAVKAAERPSTVKAGSATGGARGMSLRTRAICDLDNINHAFVRFRSHPEIAATLIRLANEEVRSQKGEKVAPGFTLRFEETAA